MTRRNIAMLVCAGVFGASVASASPRSERRAYLAAYDDHTQKLTVYNDFTTALLLRATLLDGDFRETLATERQRLLDATDDNADAFQRRMTSDLEMYQEVVFSADSAMPGPLTFGPGDDQWNVRLTADGVEQELVTVYKVRTPTPLHQGLYPHVNLWSSLWIARFHRTIAHPRHVDLHVGSGFGNGTVAWDTP